MIKELKLKNFKCFSEQSFSFSNLTVFCGSNSVGKSTAIQSILSVKQNIKYIKNDNFKFDGALFSFGRFKDVISHSPIDDEVSISINDFFIRLSSPLLNSKECSINEKNIIGFDSISKLFDNDFIYLCAERFGPRSSFKVGHSSDNLDIGIYGQFALSSYFDNQDKPVANQKFANKICSHLLTDENKKIFTSALVREAMRRICPSFSMKVVESDEMDRVYNSYLIGSETIRPVNVGFGISYILPIVISAALIKPGGILIIENPEVHLHPSAQSNLTQLLCELATSGVQVILETHSDHIIVGLWVYSKNNDFNEKYNVIHSISERSGKRLVKEIHVDGDGNLSALDQGFFDQITKDLMELF